MATRLDCRCDDRSTCQWCAKWTSPTGRGGWPLPVVLLLTVLLAALFLLAVDEGRALMCDVHEGQLAYCADYPPNEETP